MAGNAGTAIFEAVGRFGGLIKPAREASGALDGVAKSAKGIDGTMPANGGKPASGLGAVANRAGDLQKQLNNTGRSLTIGVTAPLTIMGGVAVKQFGNFETAIVSAGQKAGATKDELQQMKDLALKMGAQTKFSAGESAVALDNLAAAGFDAKGAMAALPGVMLAAQASNEDLGLTADVVARSLNAFGLEAKDSSHVADVLSQAANTTSLNMQDLADGMANAGEVGPRFGQSLESVVAWMGRLRDMGVPAASAGVAIRQSLTSLAKPTNQASALMEGLGIKTRDAKGQMLPIPDLLHNVSAALDKGNPALAKYNKIAGMSETALKAWAKANGVTIGQARQLQTAVEGGDGAFRDYALGTMFGVEGAKAFALALSDGKPLVLDAATDTEKLTALQNGLAKTMGGKAAAAWIKARTENGKFTASGADAVKALTALGTASDGTSKKFGEAFNKTTAAQIDQMKGSLETLAIVVVGAVAPALNGLIKSLTGLFTTFGQFAQAHPQLAQLAVGFLVAAVALGPLLIGISKVITAIGIIGKTGKGAIGILSKIGGSAGGTSKLAGAWDTLRLKVMYAKDAVVKAGAAIGRAFVSMAAATGRAIAAAARWAASMVASAARAVASMTVAAARVVAGWALMAARATASAVRMALAWTIGIIRQAAVAAAAFAVTVARVVAGWVLMGVQSLIQAARMAAAWLIAMGPIGWIIAAVIALVALVIANWDTIKAWTIAAWTAIVGWVKQAWEWIKGAVGTALAFVGNLIRAYMAMYIAVWTAVWNAIVAVAVAVWNWIKGVVLAGAAVIVAYVRTYMAVLQAIWAAVWGAISAYVQTVWSIIKGVVQVGIAIVKGVIAAGLALIRGDWQGAWNALKGTVSAVMSIVEGIVSGAIARIRGVLSSVGDAIKNIGDKAGALGGALRSGLGKVIPGMSTGGLVPGTGSGDKVLRFLEPGEFVLTKRAVSDIGLPVLSAANQRGGGSAVFAGTAAGMMSGAESGKVASVRAMTGVAAGVPQAAASVPVNPGDGRKTEFNTTIVNPAPEPASDSLSRTYSKIAYLGLDAEDD